MQKIIQQVLKLTAASEAKQWTELESLLLTNSSKMNKQDLIEICSHYGKNEKGSSEFWNSMSKVVLKHYKSLNAGEFCNVFEAFSHAGTQYKFSEEFCVKMVDGISFATDRYKYCLDAQDPTMVPSMKNKLDELKEEYDKVEDPFLEFTDDLKIEKLNGQEKEEALTIKAIVKDWQEKFLRFK